jgi:hypothetical protein
VSAPGDDVARLLAEIRDQQREQLEIARASLELVREQARLAAEQSERSLRNQEQAIAAQTRSIEMQRAGTRLYRVVVGVAGVLIVVLIGFAVRLVLNYT